MIDFILAPDAEDDVFQIWTYLFRRAGIETANRVEAELYNTFATLAATPGQGHQRPDLTKEPVLFFTIYQYMIVYRRKIPLGIVRVLHGRRNVRRILKNSNLE